MFNIIVTVKQVLDPEAPVSTFRIDREAKCAIPAPGVPLVLNPYDENALEAALRIGELHQSKITATGTGTKLARAVLRKCLTAGADELFLLEGDTLEDLNSYSTSLTLAAAMNKTGKYDLVMRGRMAGDTSAGKETRIA